MAKYNHAYSLGFSVVTESPEGDATSDELAEAIRRRLDDLIENDELVEACGEPVDTVEE